MTIFEAIKLINANKEIAYIDFIDNAFEPLRTDLKSFELETEIRNKYAANAYGYRDFTVICINKDTVRSSLKMRNLINLEAIFKSVAAIYKTYSLYLSPFDGAQDVMNTVGFKAYYDEKRNCIVLEAGEEQYV